MGFYKQYNVIGLMSGTSLDGVDLAFVTFYHNKSWQYQLKECQTIPYDEQWQKELKELHLKSITEIKETGKRYAVYLSQLLSNFILENNLQVDLICSHGHTILHQPEKGISLQIGDGKIINARSSKGENVLLKVLDSDEGSRRLGEVALVPNSSPISQLGITFYNTLFDENAASHIALGQCYSKCFKSKKNLSKEEIAQRGGNSSMIHIDWMIGSKDINIDGIKENNLIPVFRNGEWVN